MIDLNAVKNINVKGVIRNYINNLTKSRDNSLRSWDKPWKSSIWFFGVKSIEETFSASEEDRRKAEAYGRKKWEEILTRTAFLFREANSETCTRKNAYEAEYWQMKKELQDKEKNLLEFNTAKKDFEVTLGEYIISSDNENIEEVLVKKLKELKYTISFCESCTGGLLASSIIDVSGASSVINESLVTYSNESKIKYLNVSNQTIEKYDVASLEVAKEMSEGLFELTKSNVCVSVTGVAGPTSPNPEIPVGSVFFGVSINGETTLFSNVFKGNRSLVRQKAVKWILYKTYLLLKERG